MVIRALEKERGIESPSSLHSFFSLLFSKYEYFDIFEIFKKKEKNLLYIPPPSFFRPNKGLTHNHAASSFWQATRAALRADSPQFAQRVISLQAAIKFFSKIRVPLFSVCHDLLRFVSYF